MKRNQWMIQMEQEKERESAVENVEIMSNFHWVFHRCRFKLTAAHTWFSMIFCWTIHISLFILNFGFGCLLIIAEITDNNLYLTDTRSVWSLKIEKTWFFSFHFLSETLKRIKCCVFVIKNVIEICYLNLVLNWLDFSNLLSAQFPHPHTFTRFARCDILMAGGDMKSVQKYKSRVGEHKRKIVFDNFV